jgi:predicted nucleic acid-binding protein
VGAATWRPRSRRSCGGSGAVAVLVDAGPLYAVADADDAAHERCVDALEAADGPLLVPDLVVAEVSYLIGTRLGPRAEVRFLGSLAAGELTVAHVAAGDWVRTADLVARYHDLPLGTVHASVVAIAERLRIEVVITLDTRHFRIVRPAHVRALTLIP